MYLLLTLACCHFFSHSALLQEKRLKSPKKEEEKIKPFDLDLVGGISFESLLSLLSTHENRFHNEENSV